MIAAAQEKPRPATPAAACEPTSNPPSPDPAAAPRTSLVRGLALLGGALGVSLLAIWMPLLSKGDGGLVLQSSDWVVARLPSWLVLAALALSAAGGLALLATLALDRSLRGALAAALQWLSRHPLAALTLLVVFVLGAVDIYELLYDPYTMRWGPEGKGGLRKWMLREDVQVWLFLGATVLATLGAWSLPGVMPRLRGWAACLSQGSQRCGGARRWWLAAILAPLILGGLMFRLALEGIPHFSDALTYLFQGRVIWSGRLWIPAVPHAEELFRHSLFVLIQDGRMFGKYPVAWPAVLGMFDRIGVGFLANATLAALAVLLTGLIAREIAGRRVAVLAALVMGLSPWVWFNAAEMASHICSACAVLGFLWLFLRTLRLSGGVSAASDLPAGDGWPLASALGAGLCLAVGVLTRPQDALMFSLPAIVVVLYRFARRPGRWVVLGPLIAVGALVGVGVYLYVNHSTTGSATLSAYKLEGRWDKDWQPYPLAMLARAAFQWAELNGRFPGYGLGGLTVAMLGAMLAGGLWRTTGLRLLALGTLLFFGFCTAFGFTNVWWGPRWLFPALPLLAILTAVVLDRALAVMVREPAPRGDAPPPEAGRLALAQLALAVLAGGTLVGLACRWPGQFYLHRVMPPHSVSGAAHAEATETRSLTEAVVGMPVVGDRPPLDARAGMVFMNVPFESNAVIYVRAVPGWEAMAREAYPGRTLYRLDPAPKSDKGFEIHLLPAPKSGP